MNFDNALNTDLKATIKEQKEKPKRNKFISIFKKIGYFKTFLFLYFIFCIIFTTYKTIKILILWI